MLASAGCEEKIYEIDLQPHGDKIERRLTLTRRELRNHAAENLTANDREELERIARTYGAETPSLPRKKASFSGMFSSVLPRDVGGDGHYVHWDSPLGRVRIYVERFRGSDDISSSLDVRRKAVDQLVDLIADWFESELRERAEWPALRTLLNERIRTDLQNFSLYVWATNINGLFESTDAMAEIALRAAQYGVERNYANYEEAPRLRRELQDAMQRGDATALLTRIRRLIAVRAGGASEGTWKKSLGFLADSESVVASWHRYFVQTAYFKQHQAEVRREVEQRIGPEPRVAATTSPTSTSGAAKRDGVTPTLWERETESTMLTELALRAFPVSFHFLSDASRLRASLKAPRKPFWANGKWNEKDQRVEWSPLIAELPKPDRPEPWELPAFCFAAWDEPNEVEQKRVFGSVGLIGSDLLNYCLWYGGLSDVEKHEWDAFLPTVKKDPQPAARLEAFHFSNEPGGRKGGERLASDGAAIVTDVLFPETRGAILRKIESEPAPKAANPLPARPQIF